MNANVFEYPKDENVINKLIEMATDPKDSSCIVLDFFAGSGTTGHAVMLQNTIDGGDRKFILVQIPQPIDAKKQKDAHKFVTETLGKPEATIFEITAERIRRAGVKLEAERATEASKLNQGDLLTNDSRPLDTGFRVFELVDDPDAFILQKPMQEVTQADLVTLQTTIATPQPTQLPRVLHNLLLAEGLPLTTHLRTVRDAALYLAADTLLVVQALPLDELTDILRELKAAGTPPLHLSIYAPWIADDNFMLGVKTVAESFGLSADQLRLRG